MSKHLKIQTPGAAIEAEDDIGIDQAKVAEPGSETNTAPEPNAADLAAENARLRSQLKAERLKNSRDRSADVDHLPDQKDFIGKPRNRAVLTKDGWLPADAPKIAGRD